MAAPNMANEQVYVSTAVQNLCRNLIELQKEAQRIQNYATAIGVSFPSTDPTNQNGMYFVQQFVQFCGSAALPSGVTLAPQGTNIANKAQYGGQ